jgi:hypothetical protein
MQRLPGCATVALTAVVALALPCARVQATESRNDLLTGATESPDPQGLRLQVRAILGILVGAEAELTVQDRLRLRASERVTVWGGTDPHDNNLTDAAAYVRLLGPARNALWARAGYQYQRLHVACWGGEPAFDDRAHTVDFGLAYRYESAKGHLIEAELGKEFLRRKQSKACNDSWIGAEGDGFRYSVLGQFAVTPRLGLFARLGLRTADHLLEIKVLPEVDLGLAFRF